MKDIKDLVNQPTEECYPIVFECDLTAPSTIYQVIYLGKGAKSEVPKLLAKSPSDLSGKFHIKYSYVDNIPKNLLDKMNER